jgi:hypothetical protein
MILKTIFAMLLIPCAVFADGFPIEITSVGSSTTTVTTAGTPYVGYIESIDIDITGVTTGTLTIASATETLLTVAVTADATYRPRYITHNSSGVTLGSGTNGYSRYLLNREQLTVTLVEANSNAVPYRIEVKTVRDRP